MAGLDTSMWKAGLLVFIRALHLIAGCAKCGRFCLHIVMSDILFICLTCIMPSGENTASARGNIKDVLSRVVGFYLLCCCCCLFFINCSSEFRLQHLIAWCNCAQRLQFWFVMKGEKTHGLLKRCWFFIETPDNRDYLMIVVKYMLIINPNVW